MSIEDVIAKVRSIKNLKIKAGILGANYIDSGESVAQVAMWNEYGTSRIPPRPFMRNAIREDGERWKAELAGGLRAVLTDEASIDEVANQVGAMMQADIQKSIDSNTSPPNAKGTLKRKARRLVDKSGKPIKGASGTTQTLIDTGTLYDAISFEVEK